MDTMNKRRSFIFWMMECNPEKTQFVYIGNDPFEGVMGGDIHITGKEYMTLPPEEQGNFILHCLGETYMDSYDDELNNAV